MPSAWLESNNSLSKAFPLLLGLTTESVSSKKGFGAEHSGKGVSVALPSTSYIGHNQRGSDPRDEISGILAGILLQGVKTEQKQLSSTWGLNWRSEEVSRA